MSQWHLSLGGLHVSQTILVFLWLPDWFKKEQILQYQSILQNLRSLYTHTSIATIFAEILINGDQVIFHYKPGAYLLLIKALRDLSGAKDKALKNTFKTVKCTFFLPIHDWPDWFKMNKILQYQSILRNPRCILVQSVELFTAWIYGYVAVRWIFNTNLVHTSRSFRNNIKTSQIW